MRLTDNTVLITGGARGIGFELAKQLSQKGCKIIITARDEGNLRKAKELLPEIHTIQSDVSHPREIDALYNKVTRDFPELNFLINNAGIMRNINLHEVTDLVDLTREITTNLHGPMWMTAKFLPHLKSRPEAAVVNVSSGLAFVPLPVSPVYCATKSGLHSFTQSLRVQLKNTNVKVFELAPPATKTELLGDFPEDEIRGVSIMKVEDMVNVALKGFESDQLEIRPGQSNQLKIMSRLAPEFILKQMSRPVDRMLSTSKH
jgi:uncharacterized oxidoreductase